MPKKAKEEVLYEYFKLDEFYIRGRLKDLVDKMWVQNKKTESYFRALIDIYAISAVIGLKTGRRLEEESSEEKRTVQLKQISDYIQILKPIMQLVLMLDTSRGLSEEDRIQSAFRNPESKEEYDANMNLFNSYARGGIEYLYDQLVTRIRNDETDFFDDIRLNNMIALLSEPIDQLTL